MTYQQVKKSVGHSLLQKKQSQMAPRGIDDNDVQTNSQPPLATTFSIPSRAQRDAIRKSLFGIQGEQIQTKLTIGAPGDKYEQEADRVAAQVVHQINAPMSSQPEQSQSIQREAMPSEDELQMKAIAQLQPSEPGMTATPDLETSIQQAKGSGQPLADNIRQPMEQAFGADFSGVKVHTDAQSHQLNQSIQAKAFTTGQDIFFRQGAYNPASRGGQELIAHELTHVVQQNGNNKTNQLRRYEQYEKYGKRKNESGEKNIPFPQIQKKSILMLQRSSQLRQGEIRPSEPVQNLYVIAQGITKKYNEEKNTTIPKAATNKLVQKLKNDKEVSTTSEEELKRKYFLELDKYLEKVDQSKKSQDQGDRLEEETAKFIGGVVGKVNSQDLQWRALTPENMETLKMVDGRERWQMSDFMVNFNKLTDQEKQLFGKNSTPVDAYSDQTRKLAIAGGAAKFDKLTGKLTPLAKNRISELDVIALTCGYQPVIVFNKNTVTKNTIEQLKKELVFGDDQIKLL
jgi:hypothetical protein